MFSPKVLLVLAGLVALGAAVSPYYKSPYYNQEYYQNFPEYYQEYYQNFPEYYQNYPEYYPKYYEKEYYQHPMMRSLLPLLPPMSRSAKSYYPEYHYPEYHYPEYHYPEYYYPEYQQGGYYPYRTIKSLDQVMPVIKPTTPLLEDPKVVETEPTIIPKTTTVEGGPATLVM